MSGYKKTAVVDFDNTLSGYDKWRGPDVLGPPVPYAIDALKELREWGWRVVVFTTRGNKESIADWLSKHDLEWVHVNSTEHNPPNTSHKPIGEVYFDDRDAHCVGNMPYNWHKAMSRVRSRYQPRPMDTHIDDSSWWSAWTIRYFVAPFKRREFARELPVTLDLMSMRAKNLKEEASQIELASHQDG